MFSAFVFVYFYSMDFSQMFTVLYLCGGVGLHQFTVMELIEILYYLVIWVYFFWSCLALFCCIFYTEGFVFIPHINTLNFRRNIKGPGVFCTVFFCSFFTCLASELVLDVFITLLPFK